MTKSAYDIINLVEAELENDDHYMVNDVSDAGGIVTDIDSDLDELSEEIEEYTKDWKDKSIGQLEEFMDFLTGAVADIKSMRERLY